MLASFDCHPTHQCTICSIEVIQRDKHRMEQINVSDCSLFCPVVAGSLSDFTFLVLGLLVPSVGYAYSGNSLWWCQ